MVAEVDQSQTDRHGNTGTTVKITAVRREQVQHYQDCVQQSDGWCIRRGRRIWHVDPSWKGRLEGCEASRFAFQWHGNCPCASCESRRYGEPPVQYHVFLDMSVRLSDDEYRTYTVRQDPMEARKKIDDPEGAPCDQDDEVEMWRQPMTESMKRQMRHEKARKAKRQVQ